MIEFKKLLASTNCKVLAKEETGYMKGIPVLSYCCV